MILSGHTDLTYKIIQVNCYIGFRAVFINLLVLHKNHIHKSAPYVTFRMSYCMHDFHTALVLILIIIMIIKGNLYKNL